MKPLIEVERIDSTAVVWFNRPGELNGMTNELETEYFDALQAADGDPDVRAIIVSGRGRAFSAGADLQALQGLAKSGSRGLDEDPRGHLVALEIDTPTIAAINGPAVGMGFVHALTCDVRLASSSASFSTGFSKLGLIAEQAISWLLPQIAGRAVALDLLLSSRRIDAHEALATGLVTKVVGDDDLLPEALAYASLLAETTSPYATAVIKQQINRDPVSSLKSVVDESHRLAEAALDGPDFREGIDSLTHRRRPRYPGVPRRH